MVIRTGILVLSAGVLISAAQANILIDDFTSGFAQGTSTTDFFYTIPAVNALGGFRYVNHDFVANPLNRPIFTEVDGSTPGHMFIEAGSGVTGGVVVAWAGNSTPLNGPGGLGIGSFTGLAPTNFSAENGFNVSYINNDQASTAFTFQLFDNTNANAATATINAGVGAGTVFVPFGAIGGSIDLTNIKAVVMVVALPNGNDITLTNVEAVPEPATMVALGLGLAALARRKRKV